MIDETAEEIRAMQTHSHSVVAVKAARALEELLDREYAAVEEYLRALEQNSDALRRANPSHVSLLTTQREIVQSITGADPESVGEAKELTAETIDRVVEAVETGKEAAAAALAGLLDDGDTLLTHDYSTTVLGGIEQAVADGTSLSVYVTEARPRFLGRRTARRLAPLEEVDVTLITDGAAGLYLEECDRVVFGMDCIVEDTLYNRVGTYPISATAADRGVPATVAGASAKMIEGNFSFENDYRATSEVIREPPEGFAVENPAYDATPTRLLDSLATDEGVREL